MSNKKQTAVEWLLNEFQEAHKDFGGLDLEWLKRFNQAKEMEKQQIIEAYRNGRCDQQSKFPLYYNKTAEQNYNENYEI
jgi:hypothetical protein